MERDKMKLLRLVIAWLLLGWWLFPAISFLIMFCWITRGVMEVKELQMLRDDIFFSC